MANFYNEEYNQSFYNYNRSNENRNENESGKGREIGRNKNKNRNRNSRFRMSKDNVTTRSNLLDIDDFRSFAKK